MRIGVAGLSAMIGLFGLLIPTGVAAQSATLGRLEVRLWYEETGRLSDSIAPPAAFYGWNTIIGEGSALEIANDALFTVEVLSGGQQANVALPLTLTVTNNDGRVLGRRTIANILTSDDGRSVQALWVNDVGCAGSLTFSAMIGSVRRSTEVILDCGE